MSDKKKAAVSAATLATATDERLAEGYSMRLAQSDFSTSGPDGQALDGDFGKFFVASHLSKGEENSVSTQAVMALCGYASKDALVREIAAERRRGAVILSTGRGHGGYYLPSDGERGRVEVQRFISTLEARGRNTLAAVRSARRFLQALDGQETMPEVGCD